MKKLLFTSFLFLTTIVFSQKKEVVSLINIQSIELTVDTVEEIDRFNFQDFKDALKDNDPESIVTLKFSINKLKQENMTLSFSHKVDGKASEIDSLVAKLKEGVLKLKKVISKSNK